MTDTTSGNDTQTLLYAAGEEVRGAVNDLFQRLNQQISLAASAKQAGDAAGEAAARAEVAVLRPAYDDATVLAMQLNRAIIDWLDNEPAVAAAIDAVNQSIANLEAEKAAFAATTQALNTASAVVDGIAGVVTSVQKLLAGDDDPA